MRDHDVDARGEGVLRSYCWACARRKLCEIQDSHRSPIAAGHPASSIDKLMPWAFTPTSSK